MYLAEEEEPGSSGWTPTGKLNCKSAGKKRHFIQFLIF
jgi:hypothetical protein